MAKLGHILSSFLAAPAPTSNKDLLKLLKTEPDHKKFCKRVITAISSRQALVDARLLPPIDAHILINKLDNALDIPTISNHKTNWKRCLKFLCRLCASHHRLPFAYSLTSPLRKDNRLIGSGGFAEVWRGEYQAKTVAIKILKIYQKSNIGEVEKRFCREVLMWNRRPHPNILPLLGVCQEYFIMVSEWMENGNVRQYIAANPGVNRPATLLGALEGLNHLHSRKMVHGDLKAANILIKPDGTSCLADFGFTTIMRTETCTFSTPQVGGTLRWMSPELLDERMELPPRTIYSDRYAFGMVIYEVLTDNVPFHQAYDFTISVKVLRGDRPEIPTNTPEAAFKSGLWDIVVQCWKTEPTQRPALSEIRERLAAAAGLWVTDLALSAESYVDMAKDTLSLTDSSYDESDDESEFKQEMSPFSLVQPSLFSTPERGTTPVSMTRGMLRSHSPRHSVASPLGNGVRARVQSWREPARPLSSLSDGLWGLQAHVHGSRQSLVARRQSVVMAERDQDGTQSDTESENHLEPPSYVYAAPKPRPLV